MAVLVSDEIEPEVLRVVRAVQRNGCPRLSGSGPLDEAGMLAGIEAGFCGFLRRSETRPDTLVQGIRAAASGDGTVPAVSSDACSAR